ncbi:DUF6266 family protein [Pedobacter sp. AW31-3R]|uniref:DUF6266 family protein n=1 Tax=Pedobacter sp. AW31-3R TaxID=3445781 RepID=UPI003FA03E93
MGIVRNGILGSVSGSVGPVVLCTYRDKEVVKSKPKKSSKPAVQSQIDQRSKFKMITEIMSSLSDTIEYGYKSADKSTSAMNRAVRYHLDNAVTGVSPDFKLDLSKLRLTSVNKASLFDTEVVAVAGRMLELTWGVSEEADEALRVLRDTDYAMILFYGETTQLFLSQNRLAVRGAGKHTAKFPRLFLGDTIHGWMFFLSKDGKTVFRDAYLGEYTLIA